MKKTIVTAIATALCTFGVATIASATFVSGGLQGDYYDDATFSAPAWGNFQFSQVDPTIDFDWGGGSPNAAKLGNDVFSIKWSGKIMADTAGTYYFATASDDSSMLFVDGNQVVNNSGNHPRTIQDGNIDLTAGLHDIEMTYHEWGVWANVSLYWQDSSQRYIVIDSDHLYHDNGNNPVPEPATLFLFGTGMAGLIGVRGRKKKSS